MKENICQKNVHSVRNISLDILKFVCSFFVVCIHFAPPGSDIIQISRIAVPIFFIIGGYLVSGEKSKEKKLAKIKQSIRSTHIKFIAPTIVCVICCVICSVIQNEFYQVFGHLWFLGCMIVVDYFYYLVVKYDKEKIVYYLLLPLVLIGVLCGTYSTLVFDGADLFLLISRNALFVGIPFFFAGILLRKCKMQLTKRGIAVSILLGIVFTILQIFEYRYVSSMGDYVGDVFFSTIFASLLLAFAFINIKINVSKSAFNSYFGANTLFYVYLYHFPIGKLFCVFDCCNIFLIFVASLVTSFCITYISSFIKKKKTIRLQINTKCNYSGYFDGNKLLNIERG